MTNIINLKRTTAAKAPADNPVWESTLQETLGIRKFIEMSIADINQQIQRAAQDGTNIKLFKTQKANAYIITAWLTSALMMVDGMLAEAAARSAAPLAAQFDRQAGPLAPINNVMTEATVPMSDVGGNGELQVEQLTDAQVQDNLDKVWGFVGDGKPPFKGAS